MRTILLAAAISLLATEAHAVQPTYRVVKDQVVEIDHLDADDRTNDMCRPATFAGKVVKRQFDESGVVVTGFILEDPDGSRTAYTVIPLSNDLNMVDRGWLVQGLQTILREGHKVIVGVYQCGAAGRVLYVDRIKRGEK